MALPSKSYLRPDLPLSLQQQEQRCSGAAAMGLVREPKDDGLVAGMTEKPGANGEKLNWFLRWRAKPDPTTRP